MWLKSHISAYATHFAWKVCGLVRSTWGASLGGDKLRGNLPLLKTWPNDVLRAAHVMVVLSE